MLLGGGIFFQYEAWGMWLSVVGEPYCRSAAANATDMPGIAQVDLYFLLTGTFLDTQDVCV